MRICGFDSIYLSRSAYISQSIRQNWKIFTLILTEILAGSQIHNTNYWAPTPRKLKAGEHKQNLAPNKCGILVSNP